MREREIFSRKLQQYKNDISAMHGRPSDFDLKPPIDAIEVANKDYSAYSDFTEEHPIADEFDQRASVWRGMNTAGQTRVLLLTVGGDNNNDIVVYGIEEDYYRIVLKGFTELARSVNAN